MLNTQVHGKEKYQMTNNINEDEKLVLDSEMTKELVEQWLGKLSTAQKGHYIETEYLNTIHHWLSVLLISLTTGVTAFIFFTPETNEAQIKIYMGIASAIAAALSGIVTFGRFGERANEHRITAGRYGKLRRQLEFLQATCPVLQDKAEFKGKLKTLRIEWEYVAANAPLTPEKDKFSFIRKFLI